MTKTKQIVFNGLIFFSLISLLATATNTGTSDFLKKGKIKKEVSQKETSDFVLKAVSIEATVTYVHVGLVHIFHLIFDTFYILEIIIPQNILSPDFLDGYLEILFTKIIQAHAP